MPAVWQGKVAQMEPCSSSLSFSFLNAYALYGRGPKIHCSVLLSCRSVQKASVSTRHLIDTRRAFDPWDLLSNPT